MKETGAKYRGLSPYKITPIVGRTAREARLARGLEVDDRWFGLGDHGCSPTLKNGMLLTNG